MAKNKPGLPEGFEIDLDSPAQLGDYLDEDNTARVLTAKRANAPAAQPQKILVEQLQVSAAKSPPAPENHFAQPQNGSVLDLAEARRRTFQKPAAVRRPDRKQFNMRPDTLKMVADIVEFVQRYSLQNDAAASEIFHAVISVLHDAKEEMAFNDVTRRGKWGTPTARAFPTSLGNAFARAIASRYAKQRTP